MKKILTFALAAMVAGSSFAQSPLGTTEKSVKPVVQKYGVVKNAKAMTKEALLAEQEAKAQKAGDVRTPAVNVAVTKQIKAESNVATAGINHANALIDIPETATVYEWNMNAVSVSTSLNSPIKNKTIKIGFDGNDIYVGGMFYYFPETWIKGVLDGNTVTFAKGQFLGEYSGLNIILASEDNGNLVDVKATYYADEEKLVFDNAILSNNDQETVYYLEWFKDAVLSVAAEPLTGAPIDELPFVANLTNESEYALFGSIDANNDNRTWSYSPNYWATVYPYHKTNEGDDYFVAPAIYLTAGKNYAVTVAAAASSNSYTPESFEVVLGTVDSDPTAESFNKVIIPRKDLNSYSTETVVGEFVITESGYYHIAVHAISPADKYYMLLKSFQVELGADLKAPDAISDLQIVPGPNGQKRATLYFTTPDKAVDGTTLTDELNINIYHNEVLWKTIPSYPGVKKVVFDDGIETSGLMKYTIRVDRGELQGRQIEATEYIGVDSPMEPTNLQVTAGGDHLSFTWDKVASTGVKGYYVDPSQVSYQVWDVVDMIPGWGWYILNSQLSGDLLDADSWETPYNCDAGVQGDYIFGVVAHNEAGTSNSVMNSVYLGAPNVIPSHEGFDNGEPHFNWFVEGDAGVTFAINSEGSVDPYSIEINLEAENSVAALYSGKFNVAGAENATLTADMYATAENATVTLYVETENGMVALETLPLTEEWATYKWNVGQFANETFVRFHLTAAFVESGSLMIDNFNVIDLVSDDLAVSISAPAKLTAGQTATTAIKVLNLGEKLAEGYVVKLLADDVEVGSVENTKALSFYEAATYNVNYTSSIFDEAHDLVLKAVVEYAPELKADDNTAEAIVALNAPKVSTVENLTATTSDAGVVLEWTVPAVSYNEVTETFEDYDAYAYVKDGEQLGEWTGWDVDGGKMMSITGANWPYADQTGAFGIYNPEVFGLGAENLPSGAQAAMFMAVLPDTSTSGANDDWMVSPELPGIAQTISFMVSEADDVFGNEQFEVLASSTGNTPECFEKIADGEASREWVEFTANLPEGTKYFAIRCTSFFTYILLVDDIKYTIGGTDPTGFNVYVDEAKVATTTEKTYTITDLAAGEHKLSVTALYDEKESAPESVMVISDSDATAIKNISTADAKDIYTVSGVRVSEANHPGVYIVNGKKLINK